MNELHSDRRNNNSPWQRFEEVVAAVFINMGFEVQRDVAFAADYRRYLVDLVVTGRGIRSVVEIKAFRSLTPPIADILRAARVVANARAQLGATHAVLVINLRRDRLPQRELALNGVVLICLDDLVAASADQTDIFAELAEISRELNSGLAEFDSPTDLTPAEGPSGLLNLMNIPAGDPPPPPPPPETRGQRLAAELLEIKAGPGKHVQVLSSGRKPAVPWRLYELVAGDSFQYLFGDELGNWRVQDAVAGQDKRFDALAKVRGDDVFSRSLIEDFRSRYVIFEFKNYSDKLRPNILYVTEKYLFPLAMRSTAIILSPNGFSEDTRETARGALRDAGKLMLDITSEKLAEMLVAKDQGTIASTFMEPLLDDFLISLGR